LTANQPPQSNHSAGAAFVLIHATSSHSVAGHAEQINHTRVAEEAVGDARVEAFPPVFGPDVRGHDGKHVPRLAVGEDLAEYVAPFSPWIFFRAEVIGNPEVRFLVIVHGAILALVEGSTASGQGIYIPHGSAVFRFSWDLELYNTGAFYPA
jgi:hypothetical protein